MKSGNQEPTSIQQVWSAEHVPGAVLDSEDAARWKRPAVQDRGVQAIINSLLQYLFKVSLLEELLILLFIFLSSLWFFFNFLPTAVSACLE